MDFVKEFIGGGNPFVFLCIVAYCSLGFVLYVRHKDTSTQDELMVYALTLSGFIFTGLTFLSLMNALIYKELEAAKVFASPFAVLGFSCAASLGWCINLWLKLWKRSESNGNKKA